MLTHINLPAGGGMKTCWLAASMANDKTPNAAIGLNAPAQLR
jgi:hypothetical protein